MSKFDAAVNAADAAIEAGATKAKAVAAAKKILGDAEWAKEAYEQAKADRDYLGI